MVGSDNVAAVIDPRILGCDLDICNFLNHTTMFIFLTDEFRNLKSFDPK